MVKTKVRGGMRDTVSRALFRIIFEVDRFGIITAEAKFNRQFVTLRNGG